MTGSASIIYWGHLISHVLYKIIFEKHNAIMLAEIISRRESSMAISVKTLSIISCKRIDKYYSIKSDVGVKATWREQWAYKWWAEA